MDKRHLLVVDDQAEIRAYVKHVAEPLGYEVTTMANATTFMEVYTSISPDTIIMDVFMPDCDGVEIIQNLIEAKCKSRILVMSGSDEFFMNSISRMAHDRGLPHIEVMKKPLRLRDLRGFLLTEKKAVAASCH